MSKVILKIGPKTQQVEQSQIITIAYGDAPKTTIKYADDHSVVFFERNPFYVTITEPQEARDICNLLEASQNTSDENERARYIAMASMNAESVIAAYISRNLFEGFSDSLIKALRNSKKVGIGIGQKDR